MKFLSFLHFNILGMWDSITIKIPFNIFIYRISGNNSESAGLKYGLIL